MKGKRQLLHATSTFQTSYTQPSSTQPQGLALQQKNLPRQKSEDSGVKQREHTVCAEHWYRSAGTLRGLIKEMENTQWDHKAIGPNSMPNPKTADPAANVNTRYKARNSH